MTGPIDWAVIFDWALEHPRPRSASPLNSVPLTIEPLRLVPRNVNHHGATKAKTGVRPGPAKVMTTAKTSTKTRARTRTRASTEPVPLSSFQFSSSVTFPTMKEGRKNRV